MLIKTHILLVYRRADNVVILCKTMIVLLCAYFPRQFSERDLKNNEIQ